MRWNSRALPALTVLVGDITALQSDGSPGPGPAFSADVSRLRRDVASAAALGTPPSPPLRSDWSTTLVRLEAVVSASEHLEALSAGPVAGRQAASTSLETAVGQAAQSLLRLAAALR